MAGLVEQGHVKQNSSLWASRWDVVLEQFSVGAPCDQTALTAKLLHLKSQKAGVKTLHPSPVHTMNYR